MKTKIPPFIFLFLLIGMIFLFSTCRKKEPIAGGSCNYENYPGTVTIKSVKTPPSQQGNSSINAARNLVLVEYEFAFDKGSYVPFTEKEVFTEEIEITQEQVKEKDVKIGKKYRAGVRYQTSGTCNPGPYWDEFEDWK
jgi:hypothetical protein